MIDPRFQINIPRVVVTHGVFALLDELQQTVLLHRHFSGDWGEVDDEDKATNETALKLGLRVLSEYTIRTPGGHRDTPDDCVILHPGLGRCTECGQHEHKVWCITGADRSVTTLLLPEEY